MTNGQMQSDNPRYRHKKRETTYELIIEGIELQTSDKDYPIKEGTQLTIYRSELTGKLWARPTSEFHDGRFERLDNNVL